MEQIVTAGPHSCSAGHDIFCALSVSYLPLVILNDI